MKLIDKEIHDLEQRMARRRHEVADTARAAKDRTMRKLVSPAGLAAAAALGFVVTVGMFRKKRAPVYVEANKVKGGAAMSAVGMLMPVALAIIRAQFGSPAGMAQYVLSRMKKRSSPQRDARAPAGVPRAMVTAPPHRTVHPAR